MKTYGIAALVLGAGLAAGAVNMVGAQMSQKTVEQRLAKLEGENQRLSDIIEIQKVQALYQHAMLRGDGLTIVSLFAHRPDVEIELSNKGIMTGADAPARYWLGAKKGGPTPTANQPRPAGSLIMHMSVNPVIEVGKDGVRAKALWLSPGITTTGRGGPPVSIWNYGKYEMEYVKENGRWRILAFRWRQIFYSPADKGWTVVNLDPGPPKADNDKPSKAGFYRPYKVDETNPYDPPPPKPF